MQFADFMRDPFATVRTLYDELGRDLEPVAEQKMRGVPRRPSRRRRGHRYSWADTGFGRGAGA